MCSLYFIVTVAIKARLKLILANIIVLDWNTHANPWFHIAINNFVESQNYRPKLVPKRTRKESQIKIKWKCSLTSWYLNLKKCPLAALKTIWQQFYCKSTKCLIKASIIISAIEWKNWHHVKTLLAIFTNPSLTIFFVGIIWFCYWITGAVAVWFCKEFIRWIGMWLIYSFVVIWYFQFQWIRLRNWVRAAEEWRGPGKIFGRPPTILFCLFPYSPLNFNIRPEIWRNFTLFRSQNNEIWLKMR
jgi:hypothetical protein